MRGRNRSAFFATQGGCGDITDIGDAITKRQPASQEYGSCSCQLQLRRRTRRKNWIVLPPPARSLFSITTPRCSCLCRRLSPLDSTAPTTHSGLPQPDSFHEA